MGRSIGFDATVSEEDIDPTVQLIRNRIFLFSLGERFGASLKDILLEQRYTFGDLDRDPPERVVTVAHYGLVNLEGYDVHAGTDALNAAWFSMNDLPELAFDHETILSAAYQRLQGSA